MIPLLLHDAPPKVLGPLDPEGDENGEADSERVCAGGCWGEARKRDRASKSPRG